ncbi:MAG: aromatic ring hydroxylase [Candidatus Latescibacterota bacterium]|nr:MAG: aromatic ring hydroxylase [Candidatus Latescibacterota bacterium]HDH99487.1 metal-sulfur cluster assembly factor [Bacillota bacterium]
MVTEEKVWEALKGCYDPEIPVNIVDLGLVYEVKVEDGDVRVKMTMTAPGCPLSAWIARQAEDAVRSLEGVKDVHVELVWDPPWTPDRMSEEAKRTLGLR